MQSPINITIDNASNPKKLDINLSETCFYSDSFNDLPLLEKVREAIVVDGDEKLLREAKKNGWSCVSFR